jgi:protein tyrosine/serine phosphatase
MVKNRKLNWDGCNNVRDLGGIITEDGRKIHWGAFVRSDHPNKLSSAGWEALYAHGIRTIISLETDGMEDEALIVPEGYLDINPISVAIEDLSDNEFLTTWAATDLWCTPLYYQDAISRWPERHAAVFSILARAQPGGVLIHCMRGMDRTGIITMMLLALLGISPEETAKDYLMSPDPERDKILQKRNTNAQQVIINTSKELDMKAYLLGAGLSQADIEKIKERLLTKIQTG